MGTVQNQLIDGLTNPAVLPYPCNRVELVETHISWVLLTGQRAYKIKKPVDFGFVDFTTLERRRHFCEEEIRLNRRLAPDLYLGVVPVTGTIDQPRIGGDGPVIDYAVEMKQFDQQQLLSHLPLHVLSPSHIDNLADQCADFHQLAHVADATSRYGRPGQIMQPVRDNFELLCHADQSIHDLVETLRDHAEHEFRQLLPVFSDRKQSGMIRECHGDLHLGNMFLQDDRVTVFDAIDFNDDLRRIDIICDIAFAVMDFEDRGCPEIAARFLNRWLERTGDYAGLKVLPFYAAYRATVRAKIDAIRIHQPDLTQSDQRHLSNDCRGYLELARRFTRNRPLALMITSGPSGSGKTTVTQKLIDESGLIRVRSDTERKRLHGMALEEHSRAEQKATMYSADARAETYDRLAELARTVIDAGFPVVVDATFLQRHQREEFARLAGLLNVPFLIIRCDADADELRKRVEYRQHHQHDASEADVQVLEAQLADAEPLTSFEQAHCVDSSSDDFADRVHRFIATSGTSLA
ncbi:MAG: AAA family ATPase [Planctomycetaceae bacterium]